MLLQEDAWIGFSVRIFLAVFPFCLSLLIFLFYIVQKSGDENLKKIYNECVESLIQFRSFHIQIVTRLVRLGTIGFFLLLLVSVKSDCSILLVLQ